MGSSHNFTFPRIEGKSSRQAHADLPEGTFERELGREGFFGPATMMYHRNPPTGWTQWTGPLRPRAFDLTRLSEFGKTVWDAPVVVSNAFVRMRIFKIEEDMRYLARNGDGDELLFVHEGAGHLYCDYGHLEVTRGDYIVIPRSTMWRFEITSPMTLLLVESTNGSIKAPDRGMLGRHALYDEALFDTPKIDEAFADQRDAGWDVLIWRRNALSSVRYPFNPLDAVGWHGDLAPVRLNIKDIRPVSSHRYHLPPSAHTTWVGNRFVICTFVPRPFETDPAVLKVPFFHNNDDFDEVVFYHDGDFFSRDNIHPGMVTWHPCGFTHGPHPKALQAMYKPKNDFTKEYAVMLDTRDGLDSSPQSDGVEFADYAESWRTSGPVVPPSIPDA